MTKYEERKFDLGETNRMTNPKANLLLTFHEALVSLHSAEMRVKVLYTGALQSSSHFATVDKVQRSWQEGC